MASLRVERAPRLGQAAREEGAQGRGEMGLVGFDGGHSAPHFPTLGPCGIHTVNDVRPASLVA